MMLTFSAAYGYGTYKEAYDAGNQKVKAKDYAGAKADFMEASNLAVTNSHKKEAKMMLERVTPANEAISDEEVLELVNPAYPGLKDFAAAMKANDLAGAHRLLVKHFATRQKPFVPASRFPFVDVNSALILQHHSFPIGKHKKVADDEWLKHIFTESNYNTGKMETYDLGADIRWNKNPSTSMYWHLYLNQLNFLAGLARVYKDTGDDKYAKGVGDLIVSWVRQMPADEGGGMQTRNRLCNCIAAYDVVRKSPSLTPEMHMAFWKVFITHSRGLVPWTGSSYAGLIPAAVIFPEFKESVAWLSAGKANLANVLVDRTTPEGAGDIHSISYQFTGISWPARCLELFRANPGNADYGEITRMIQTQVGKRLELYIRLRMPNQGIPNIGDAYSKENWSGDCSRLLKAYMIIIGMSSEERKRLEAIKDPYSRLKAVLATIDGTDTKEPAGVSMSFPGTGYYVMRSSWEPQTARYLFFDLSPEALWHNHADACHIDLYAYGKPLLTDAGGALGWGYRTALHNTIEVDEQQHIVPSMRRVPQAKTLDKMAAWMMPCEWITTEGYDFVDGAHTGYEHLGVIHRRKVFFVKPDYFILCDLLTGKGSHKYEQFFRFAGPTRKELAQAEINPQSLTTRSLHEGTANIQIIPSHIEGLHAAFFKPEPEEMDDKDLRAAFSKPDSYFTRLMVGRFNVKGRWVKSPVAVYTREGELPVSFHDVLFPTAANTQADVRVTALTVTQQGAVLPPHRAAGMKIEWTLTGSGKKSKGTDYFFISHEGAGARNYGEFSFDGELCLVRKDAAGKISQISIKTGSTIREGDRTLISAGHLIDAATARWDGECVSLDCLVPYGISVLAQKARQVKCGDKPVKVSKKNEMLVLAAGADQAPLKIVKPMVSLNPAQKGLIGGQPWAVVTWRTARPATTQVEFIGDDGLVRRTILDRRFVTDHSARVEFLRRDEQYTVKAISALKKPTAWSIWEIPDIAAKGYTFKVVSVDKSGKRAEAKAEAPK